METDSEDKDHARDPYFVYLMVAAEKNERAVRRVFTHIGKSRTPVFKVLRHNEGRVNTFRQATRKNAPNWRLEEWVGPFNTREKARAFQRLWFTRARPSKTGSTAEVATATRAGVGVKLAIEHQVAFYTPRLRVRSQQIEAT